MKVALITHPACLEHDPGAGHPERPERIVAVLEALVPSHFPDLFRHEAPAASREQLAAAHDSAYIDSLFRIDVRKGERLALDPDTILSEGSVEAARRGAGAAIQAVDLVMTSGVDAAFAAVRPPGHHARPNQAMGFCLFNNAAVAVTHARSRWGVSRIAIADFDVHHGNGTQEIFWDDPDILFVSSHQSPCYPGTGSAMETGAWSNIANGPLPPQSGSPAFRKIWSAKLLPALDAFQPELLIISAGFDGHRADPLAHLELEAEDYGWLTAELQKIAQRHGRGRIVSLLEGGYDLSALSDSVSAHIHALQSEAV